MVRHELEDEVEEEHDQGGHSRHQPLSSGETLVVHLHDLAGHLDHNHLQDTDHDPDHHEQPVVANVGKDGRHRALTGLSSRQTASELLTAA